MVTQTKMAALKVAQVVLKFSPLIFVFLKICTFY